MKNWSVWIAAVLLGGLLGWISGSMTTQTPSLPLLDVATSAAEPPGRLATSESASKSADSQPASASTTDREKSVRAVIDRQLPQATAEEREIWFEQLKELPPGVVDDLLNVRKQFQEVVPPLRPRALTAPKSPDVAPRTSPVRDDAAWQPSSEALLKVRQVTLHNLANADTAGYSRLDPVLWPDGRNGVRWGGTRRDLRPGPIRKTERLLDVAIDGEGWFVVEEGDTVIVTRRGQFAVLDGGLALLTVQGTVPVTPRIGVPTEISRVEITSLGVVMGWKATKDLVELGQLELALLSDAGLVAFDADQPLSPEMIYRTKPGSGAGVLVPASLEQSNVVVAEEQSRLQWIDEWLQRTTSSQP